MANMTIKKAKELISNTEKFEVLEATEIAEIAEVLTKSTAKDAEAMMDKFAKLIKERKEIAPAEEIPELVAIENSAKIANKATPVNKKAQAKAETKAPKKFVPKAKKNEAPKAEKTPEVIDSEDENLEVIAKQIDSSNYKELQALAKEYGVKLPSSINTANLRKLLHEQIIGFEPVVEEPPVEKATPVNDSPFPKVLEDAGLVKVDYKDLSKEVQSNPYKVIAYVQEKGLDDFSAFTVIFANKEIVVLLDSEIVKNSVITCDKAHFSKNGTILSLDDNLCPVAFYKPMEA